MAANSDEIPDDLKARYSNFQFLGAGGMGRVYQAFDSSLAIDVAIKVLPKSREIGAYAARFQQEARAASKLKHKNLVTILDFGIIGGEQPYLVMEHIKGRTLASILDTQTRLSLAQSINIMMQVCHGMKHAHSAGVVHRDLKPENIIVLHDDFLTAPIKILDFGIAKVDGSEYISGFLTPQRVILGTPQIMSPEQISSDPVDHRSDIYSCGCLLFRMLSGRYPYEGESALELMQLKVQSKAPQINEMGLREKVSSAVEDVVSKCLEIDPNDRFDSMSEFEEALVDASEVLDQTISDPDVPLTDGKRFSFRKVGLIGIVALVLIPVTLSFFSHSDAPPLSKANVNPLAQPKSVHVVQESTVVRSTRVRDLFEQKDGDTRWIARTPLNDDALAQLLDKPINDLKIEDQALITKRGCSYIAQIPNLKNLSITDCAIGNDAVGYFAGMPSLRKLSIEGCRVTDAGIVPFANSKIEDLGLARTLITDKCLTSVAKMKDLTRLILSGTQITNDGLKSMSELPLTCLHLEWTGITDDGMKYLPGRRTMERLYIENTQISERGLRAIAEYPIVYLLVGGCAQVDDDCVDFIVKTWPGLQVLSLSDTAVTANGVKKLAALHELKELKLAALRLNDESLEPVLNLKNLEQLTLRANNISDVTLERIAKLPKIDKVDLTHCDNTTKEGKEKLQETLKELRIHDPAKGIAVPGAIETFTNFLQ